MDHQQIKSKLKCRACDGVFFDAPLLKYSNMPASAQGFLSQSEMQYDQGVDVEVCQCASCGLVQLSTPPVSYYRDVIRAAAFSPDMGAFRVSQFKQWATQYALVGKKVLEIGCGKGEYLTLLKDSGLDAYGIEHAQASVVVCQHHGLKVTQAYLGDAAEGLLDAGPFDGFVCLNFMEHWPAPRTSLQALLPQLNAGAIGLIEVPNFDMIVKKGLFSEFIADHLLYFTQATLTHFLQNNGFEVLECNPVWQDYILSAVVRKREMIDLAFFADFRQKISLALHGFLDQFSAGEVAVWGAGHQALAVIALADIGGRIAYVVDSAPFKQGKFTPASHVPIVAPAQLLVQPVKAMIVMAASYSDEVARIICNQYPHVQQVVILRDDGLQAL